MGKKKVKKCLREKWHVKNISLRMKCLCNAGSSPTGGAVIQAADQPPGSPALRPHYHMDLINTHGYIVCADGRLSIHG